MSYKMSLIIILINVIVICSLKISYYIYKPEPKMIQMLADKKYEQNK